MGFESALAAQLGRKPGARYVAAIREPLTAPPPRGYGARVSLRHLPFTMVISITMLLAACGHVAQPTDTFEYTATAGWYVGTTPNVTSLTIDGQAYASGAIYTIDIIYPTYEDALSSFVPRNVVITTTTETRTFQLDIGACGLGPPMTFDMPFTKETDGFYALPSRTPGPTPSVTFFSDCGSCESKDMSFDYCS